MRTILGLGNPGPEYAETRHNAGFWLADHLAARWGLGAWKRERWFRLAGGDRGGQAVRLVKPHTYMNRSGAVLGLLRATAPLDLPTDLLVLVDDVALPAGRFRLRATGSAGGHHGLESLEAAVGGRDYSRLRVGVGPKPTEVDLADFVLEPPTQEDRERIQLLLDPMAEAVECWLSDGIERAMTRYNRWPHKENPDDDPVG